MTSPIVPSAEEGPEDGRVEGLEEAPPRPTRRRLWAVLAVVAVLLTAATVASFLIQLPYYLIQPGSVRPANDRIEIDGARSYDDPGEIMFTTVLQSRATPALMVRAWLDDAVEVRSEEEMFPGGNQDEVRRENLARMDISKLVATRVALQHLGIDAEFDASGARVLGLLESSPSKGLLRPGDVIVAVDGGQVGMPEDIAEELSDRRPGDSVTVEVRRPGPPVDGESAHGGSGGTGGAEGGATKEVEVKLGSAKDPEDGSVRPVLGVSVEPVDLVVESPVEVHVSSGKVSGPSAGLAWTLGIIDQLTPGSLTGGRRIAVTGEIRDDGSVGAVGGVAQKVAAVKRAGIDLFIFPAATPEDEQREMRRIAGDEVTLRPVSNIDEAVDVLAPGGLRKPR